MRIRKRDLDRIWGKGGLRAFISHTNKHGRLASELKDCLHGIGVSAFVAHEDIEPNTQWQKEILRALFSMDLFIALITEDFGQSQWTDQEVGVAMGRETPTVSISIATDPHGFISGRQAISGSGEPNDWAETLFKIALDHSALRSQASDAFILAVERVTNFSEADHVFESYLPKVNILSSKQHLRLVDAFNKNHQVYEAFRYNRQIDVPKRLQRITAMPHSYSEGGKLLWEPF